MEQNSQEIWGQLAVERVAKSGINGAAEDAQAENVV